MLPLNTSYQPSIISYNGSSWRPSSISIPASPGLPEIDLMTSFSYETFRNLPSTVKQIKLPPDVYPPTWDQKTTIENIIINHASKQSGTLPVVASPTFILFRWKVWPSGLSLLVILQITASPRTLVFWRIFWLNQYFRTKTNGSSRNAQTSCRWAKRPHLHWRELTRLSKQNHPRQSGLTWAYWKAWKRKMHNVKHGWSYTNGDVSSHITTALYGLHLQRPNMYREIRG